MATTKKTISASQTKTNDSQPSAVEQRLDRIIELLEQLNQNMPLKGLDTSRFVKD